MAANARRVGDPSSESCPFSSQCLKSNMPARVSATSVAVKTAVAGDVAGAIPIGIAAAGTAVGSGCCCHSAYLASSTS